MGAAEKSMSGPAGPAERCVISKAKRTSSVSQSLFTVIWLEGTVASFYLYSLKPALTPLCFHLISGESFLVEDEYTLTYCECM